QAQFWKLLYAISSDTKQEYDASRELRSGKHDNETFTLLYRLANHMEQPWRFKARARLRRVLTFRNATVPKYNLPLKIPFLAHNDFKTNAQEFVTRLIRQHRHVLTPHHLPTKTTQEMPHPALNKASPTSAQPSRMSVLATPSFHPKDVYTTKFSTNFAGGSSTILFPNDDRIMENFESFFEEQRQRHEEQQRYEPRLTHRLVKHRVSALPHNYIIHNEDHANAHLMIYCPNVYNQAAVNTWMDKKTFLLDKSPEDIKADMARQTPATVRKHYKKLLDYNEPIPYGYIMMKRKKQWSNGRTIIAYSNTCVGRLLRVAALALQQMLKATWPHHFGNIATPQLWQEVHELLQANEEQPERELIFLNHDLVGFFNSIPQADIIQSVRYLIAEYVDNRAIIVDKEALHTNPYIWQLASATFFTPSRGDTGYRSQQARASFASAAEPSQPHVPVPNFSLKLVEEIAISLEYPSMDLYRWMEQRASGRAPRRRRLNPREDLPEHLQLHHLPLKDVLQMEQQVHVWSCRTRRPDQCHRQNTTNQEYNHALRVKSTLLADAHGLACDMAIQHTEITAYALLEVTHDLRTLMHLAQVNKVTWIHCSQLLKSTHTDFKTQANAPWHKRAGRAIDANHEETPIDIKTYLFNKRIHTWYQYHHELSYQQYMDLQVRELLRLPQTAFLKTMDAVAPTTPPSSSSSYDYSDEGDTYAAQHVLTNATLLTTILKFHTEIRVRMVAVSVEDTPAARHANQAMQGAMDAIVQQHPQAQHTTVIRDYRPQHTLIEKLVSPDIVYSLLLTNLQAPKTEIIYGKPLLSFAEILSLRVGEYQ
ncbi:unnamed protein product, partial [Symbiodinium necroappetens]